MLAGTTKRINVHSLRHTYATHLLEDGITIFTIEHMMGHANVRTIRFYASWTRQPNNSKV